MTDRETRPDSALVEERDRIAHIIDPHCFVDNAKDIDPILDEMVKQSREDALRKADRILAALSRPDPCPSCDGLNISCPEGCGRDKHGELDGSTSVRPDPATLEMAAKVVERRMEQRFEECGTREWDTNATYYSGAAGEMYEALDEEDEAITQAIRALIKETSDE